MKAAIQEKKLKKQYNLIHPKILLLKPQIMAIEDQQIKEYGEQLLIYFTRDLISQCYKPDELLAKWSLEIDGTHLPQ